MDTLKLNALKIHPVILSGGGGTRLWPLSRVMYPKQFLNIQGDFSLFQQTLLRVKDTEQFYAPLIICNDDHRFLVAEQLRSLELRASNIILEPEGKNTAPAILLAACQLLATDPNPVMLVLPSDHQIADPKSFIQKLNKAFLASALGYFVTFGIKPNKPETGYGYIQVGESIQKSEACKVLGFYEKPDLKTAEQYLTAGKYLWNSGMFLLNAKDLIAEMSLLAPNMVEACQEAIQKAKKDIDFIRPDPNHFMRCPNESIDYALMEKTKNIAVVPLQCGWSDVGAWSALWENEQKDNDGNVVLGDVIIQESKNTYIRAEDKLVACLGVEDIVVVTTKDAVLVMSREKSQKVKNITKFLEATKRQELINHPRVFRPWGYYEVIDAGEKFQAKRILVKPGAKLSLQRHHHRSEHWVVVKGMGRVTKGNEQFDLKQNESTYIPIGVSHRLENLSELELEMIEVQSGEYLGEDDIVRLEDVYGRVETVESEMECV